MHKKICRIIYKIVFLSTLLLVSAPLLASGADASGEAERHAKKDAIQQKIEDNSDAVFWSSLGGSAVAACGVAGLSMASPVCLAFPLAGPVGLVAMLAGTGVGFVIAQDWDGWRIFSALGLSGLAGGLTGVAAGFASLIVVNIAAGVLVRGRAIYDPMQAGAIGTASLLIASLSAAAVMLGGGALASWGIRVVYHKMAEDQAKSQRNKRKARRRRRHRSQDDLQPEQNPTMAY